MSELPPFDPTKPNIWTEEGFVNREKQLVNLFVPLERLCELLGITDDHRAIKVSISSEICEPGILLMVEGPGGHVVSAHGVTPVYIESLDRFLHDIDSRIKSASDHWLGVAKQRAVAESEEKGFGT